MMAFVINIELMIFATIFGLAIGLFVGARQESKKWLENIGKKYPFVFHEGKSYYVLTEKEYVDLKYRKNALD